MTISERKAACALLNRSESAIFNLLREATAGGKPRTLEAIAGITSPLAELGYLVLSGRLELTSAGQGELSEWRSRHNIGGSND